MLSSQTGCDPKRSFERDQVTRVGDTLAAYFEAARGAFSRNTERALRSDVQIFAAWCRRHLRAALPADAADVVAFIDEMARVKTPATVRRYVSSIATLHRALQYPEPARQRVGPLRPEAGCTGIGDAGRRKFGD